METCSTTITIPTIVANARAATFLLEAAATAGLPMPFNVDISDYDGVIRMSFRDETPDVCEYVVLWADFLGVEVRDQGDRYVAEGSAYDVQVRAVSILRGRETPKLTLAEAVS